jgi:hypothetical protein
MVYYFFLRSHERITSDSPEDILEKLTRCRLLQIPSHTGRLIADDQALNLQFRGTQTG